MSIRKYLFWIRDDGIKTYKVTGMGKFEVMRPAGRDTYPNTDLAIFFEWFHKSASITEDEFIDFCFLSNKPIDSPLLKYTNSTISSWDKKEISIFCNSFMNYENYEVYYGIDKKFICQNGNVLSMSNLKQLYLKCIPEFSIETKEQVDFGSEGTSLINRFFIDRLRELGEK